MQTFSQTVINDEDDKKGVRPSTETGSEPKQKTKKYPFNRAIKWKKTKQKCPMVQKIVTTFDKIITRVNPVMDLFCPFSY